MAYADLEVFVRALPDGGHAVDMRFRRADGSADSELASNVPITLDLAALNVLLGDPAVYGRATQLR